MPLRMAHEPGGCGGALLLDTDVLIDDLRDGLERQWLDAFVEAFEVLPFDRQAAGATLWTLNRRHFPMLADGLVPDAEG